MQYLLTQEEYDILLNKAINKEKELKDTIQDLCTKVCDNMPIKLDWGEPEMRPWKCILTLSEDWYCDQCPVQDVCPNDFKNWSK